MLPFVLLCIYDVKNLYFETVRRHPTFVNKVMYVILNLYRTLLRNLK